MSASYTVFCRKACPDDDCAETYVVTVTSDTANDAVAAAKKACVEAWKLQDTSEVVAYGICAGEAKVLAWADIGNVNPNELKGL